MFTKVSSRFSPNLLCRVLRDLQLSTCINNTYSTKNPSDTDIEQLLKDSTNFEHDKQSSQWSTTPYPKTCNTQSDQNELPVIDPSDTTVLLFPGQGIIKVGKIKEYLKFPRVKYMFEIANEALGYDILKICTSGPQNVFNRTEYNQAATVLTSLAAVEKLHEERPLAIDSCVSVAGYSVGEIAALIFTGAINFESGIRLVGVRAAAMQKASDTSPQAMISVFCSASAKLNQILKDAENWARDLGVEKPVCRIAIYLGTQTKILGGSLEAIKYIEKNGHDFGLRHIKRLPVSGAFHTPLMQPAVEPFKEALNSIQIHDPVVPVYSNATGELHRHDAKLIKKYLTKQLTLPVKWEQIIQRIYVRDPNTPLPRTFDVASNGAMKTILNNIHAKAANSAYVV